MLAALLRLIVLRPLFSLALFGIPIVVLVAVGLFTIMALKFLLFVVLPIVALVWIARRFWREDGGPPA